MPQRLTYDTTTVDALERALRQAPSRAPAPLSKRDVLSKLRDPITALRKRGYTWEEIASVLSAEGFPVSANLLQTYVSRTAGKAKASKGPRRAKSGTPPVVSTSALPTDGSVPASTAGAVDDSGWDSVEPSASSQNPVPAPPRIVHRPAGPSVTVLPKPSAPVLPKTSSFGFAVRPDDPKV